MLGQEGAPAHESFPHAGPTLPIQGIKFMWQLCCLLLFLRAVVARARARRHSGMGTGLTMNKRCTWHLAALTCATTEQCWAILLTL